MAIEVTGRILFDDCKAKQRLKKTYALSEKENLKKDQTDHGCEHDKYCEHDRIGQLEDTKLNEGF